jgi:3-isopropylmalate/(R)-2-methylmalate dehydratase large subunit
LTNPLPAVECKEKMSGKTAYQKIVDSHLKKRLGEGRMLLSLDRVWGHEITTPNAILDMSGRGLDVVFDPNKIKLMIDHVSPAKDTATALQGKIIRDWGRKHKIEFLEVGRNGVCHAVIPEMGWILPGEIGIMGDSHTCTHGAFCAFTAGVGTTDLEGGMITGLWICPPQKVKRVNFTGKRPDGVFAKDFVLAFLKEIGVSGATNAVLEFGGPAVEALSMEARMTITNMAVEAGATSGMMLVDRKTIYYLWPVLKKKYPSPARALQDLKKWNSDADCDYDEIIEIDVSRMVPLTTRNFSPADVVAVSLLKGKKIDQVFIGSCTNGRLEDLKIAARVFKAVGKPVAEGVRCLVVPATPGIWRQAEQEGLLDIFMQANCCVSNPSCAACLGMSCGVIAPGEVCVSTTNRNFPGRMGVGGMVHLASPAVAAMSAIRGVIAAPKAAIFKGRDFSARTQAAPGKFKKVKFKPVDYKSLLQKHAEKSKVFSGSPFYLKLDNVDTDQIIPARYLTETDKAKLGEKCLEGAPLSAEERQPLWNCQVLVAGENFGSGSSREHAVWALEEVGIKCVIAASFARIFYNNMFNNGLLCVELPAGIIAKLFEARPQRLEITWDTGKNQPGKISWSEAVDFKISEYQKELIRKGGLIGVLLEES